METARANEYVNRAQECRSKAQNLDHTDEKALWLDLAER